MTGHSCNHETPKPTEIKNMSRYRRVLWMALIVNAAMFFVEIVGSYGSASLALLADAIDFGGDALNYGVSLAVLTYALAWRARAAVLKAFCMIGFGLFVLGSALVAVWNGRVPNAAVMGGVAVVALIANVAVAWMLYAYREGDANMRSVWLCSRNDAIGNVAVMFAALWVFGTGSAWPDLAVASLMAALAVHSGWTVLRQARGELQSEDEHGH